MAVNLNGYHDVMYIRIIVTKIVLQNDSDVLEDMFFVSSR